MTPFLRARAARGRVAAALLALLALASAPPSRASVPTTVATAARGRSLFPAWALIDDRDPPSARPAPSSRAGADTLDFVPADSLVQWEDSESIRQLDTAEEDEWLRAPFGDDLLTDPDAWRSRHGRHRHLAAMVDSDRVDPLRLGVGYQAQMPGAMLPRLGARVEYAFGRERMLYGVQFEQPLAPPGRLAVGVTAVRVTGHSELHQVDDFENSLAVLFARLDFRDYFEREGIGAYVSWRVPDFSTVSAHVRADIYRSLEVDPHVGSWTHQARVFRPNPAIDDGEIHSATLRLERLTHRTRRTRAGLYHWVDIEWAGQGLGGDFTYTRALADVRSVLRLSPATTLSLRAVGGSAMSGALPVQKAFVIGGVDGLRAHAYSAFQGDQMALGQAEYTVDLLHLTAGEIENGLQAIAFVDAGQAWTNADHVWDIGAQRVALDGGFGLGSSEDNLRVYVAKNLREPSSAWVFSVRLQRPF